MIEQRDISTLIRGSSGLTSNLHNYNTWLCEKLDKLGPLEGTILDVGCGCGGLTRVIGSLPLVERVIANDVSSEVQRYFQDICESYPHIEYLHADISTEPSLFASVGYDLAISVNTLEHVEDDAAVLRAMVWNARRRTALVIVPAFNCLYGTCDADGGHLRRYSKKSFYQLTVRAGLVVNYMSYFNMIGAFGWWLNYVFLKKRNYEDHGHLRGYSAFDKLIVPFYSRVEKLLICPFGLSLIARVIAV